MKKHLVKKFKSVVAKAIAKNDVLEFSDPMLRALRREYKAYKREYLSLGGSRETMYTNINEVYTRIRTMAGERSPKALAVWHRTGLSVRQLENMVKLYNRTHRTSIKLQEYLTFNEWADKKAQAIALNAQLKAQGITDGNERARIISQQIYGSE